MINACITVYYPPAGRAPEYVHRDFLNEAEYKLFECPTVTMICKSFIFFYRLCFKNPLAMAIVRYTLLFSGSYYCLCIRICNCRSGAKIWRKDCTSYNSRWDYNKVFCYPIKDHMSTEDAEVEWLLLMDSWQRFAFENPCVDIFETERMGLGTTMLFE
jgi:hypothetical protein